MPIAVNRILDVARSSAEPGKRREGLTRAAAAPKSGLRNPRVALRGLLLTVNGQFKAAAIQQA
jgi:hypothetical protein